MPLSAGTRLGPYEILAPLGAGGMGEVYRCRDPKLERDVAIKVLPEALARDPERLARFEREAKVLASLNHPNIAAIYGLEDGALVMELVEGESPKGPLPFDEAWKIASQIAGALEYAHDNGIVHRDLKPANLKITPDGVVKLLDFGLAKAFTGPAPLSGNDENSPTLTFGGTQVGVILGTAAYMAPEQARGQAVDKRADIWAFGVILYELLTGERLFKGSDATDTLARVLTKDPELSKIPTQARSLLRECLEKDPKQRLRDIGDAKRLIAPDGATSATRDHGSTRRQMTVVRLAGVVLVIAVAALSWGWWSATRLPDRPLLRFSVDLGPEAVSSGRISALLSPDGKRLLFSTRGPDGRPRLASRLLDQSRPAPISGSEGAENPFFSPDSQWIGYFAGGKLQKISVQGGAPTTLCDASNGRGGSWGDDSNIVFTPSNSAGLFRVAASGGMLETLTKPKESGDRSHRWPQVLPGSQAVLFTAHNIANNYENARIDVLSLRTGQRKTLIRGGYYGRFMPTHGSSGYLVYVHEGTLFAVGFDAGRLELVGTPIPVLDDVAGDFGTGSGQFDFSRTGSFVYLSGTSALNSHPIMWLDSSGKMTPLLAKPDHYSTPRFSPDGKRLAFTLTGPKSDDVWVDDLQRDTPTQLTFTAPGQGMFAWAPDSAHLAYPAFSPSTLWWIRADGSGEPQRLLANWNGTQPTSVAPDGKHLVFDVTANGATGLWILPLDLSDAERPKPGKPEALLTVPFTTQHAAFSPDGRWIAYTSNESGVQEVFVRSYRPSGAPGGRWKVSTAGGNFPVWAGRQLFFLGGDDRIMVSDWVANGEAFLPEKPRVWSAPRILRTAELPPFDIAPDGKRAAVFPTGDTLGPANDLHITFLMNFGDELRRRIPAGR